MSSLLYCLDFFGYACILKLFIKAKAAIEWLFICVVLSDFFVVSSWEDHCLLSCVHVLPLFQASD